MPSVSGGLEQADNAQAGMDIEAHRIVEQPLTQHPNDPQEIEPLIPEVCEQHNLSLKERFRENSEPPQNPRSVHREASNTDQGRKGALRETQIHG